MIPAIVTGAVAGTALGYVLQRTQLCFHATVGGPSGRRLQLSPGWLFGVAVASVGLSVVFLTPLGRGLNQGLPFVPAADVTGGLLIGLGMAVARTCVSGLFHQLGAGMIGSLAGLVGWAAGELTARRIGLPPGPTLLPGGVGGTVPGLLGVPRIVAALGFAGVTGFVLSRRTTVPRVQRRSWDWPVTGLLLGAATTAAWVLAGLGGASFGPSSVGAVTSIVTGRPQWWLTSFLAGIVAGAAIAARTAPRDPTRPDRPPRYLHLAAGGFLLGAGGWIAMGCNLGHGLSGAAQLNVSSWVVVAAITAGIGAGQLMQTAFGRVRAAWAGA
ncbi:MAG: YeeE/YedE thiosulfate transporter family protein [Betaproteobacteria bacterium]